ncbi:CD209 antigen-like protein 2 [Channa argus]|uniref:CD209 antigen-like protein 2 n=1 Tax=Channa argus TaxID=215402 RepID=A0A6G1QXB3_CHAAH|nr:CD209 antigen-like protein 2 [Channa argus]
MSSSDIYAKPDLARKVRYNRKVEKKGTEWKEREVEIYNIRVDPTDFPSQEGGPQTENWPPDDRKTFRGAALCLGVLCLLLTAGIIVLFVHVTKEKEQLQTRLNNLSNSYNHLQNEVKQLQDQITRKSCPNEWKRFECSCYFKSTQKKSWSESRKDCQDRGSDLVIINSKEEQKFVTELNENEESWIGLRTTENKTASTGYRWEWVDDSPLTETFWATAELGNATGLNVASCCDQRGKWSRSGYKDNVYRKWICEK